ncbi:hypothetical protein ACFV27_00705 [Streptomyces antimycoticus]|uniref:hypothetical protein n=1 Tax=Streptomyces antimycoticus TaxID=68175 RepID=UPI0036ACCF50
MTARPDEEAVRESVIPVDVLRLTPLRASTPDHAAAVVCSLDDRATLALLNVYRLPSFSSALPVRSVELRRVMAGLLTGEDCQHGNALALVDRFLYDHHADGVAVETWGQADPTGEQDPGRPWWVYVLMPRVNRLPFGVEGWPPEEPEHVTVHAAGEVHPNPAHTWAGPRPYPGPERPLDEGTYLRRAATRTPPPRPRPARDRTARP